MYCLLDDLLIYVFTFLEIKSIIQVQLKLTSKYLNQMINENNQSYHYFHMQTIEYTPENNTRYKLMECFESIKSLEQNKDYKKSKLFSQLPSESFFEEFVTKCL
eukprot:37802_1